MITTKWEILYRKSYQDFINSIIEWGPDFFVPVGRKSCKLFESVSPLFKGINNKIRYLDFFSFQDLNLDNKKIAIIDDSVYTGSSLNRHKQFFQDKYNLQPDNIRTYGFVCDSSSKSSFSADESNSPLIFMDLTSAAYQEYISVQSEHLLLKGSHPDIEHMVIEIEIDDIPLDTLNPFIENISNIGYTYELEPFNGIERYGLDCSKFFSAKPILNKMGIEIESDFVEKIRFSLLKDLRKLQAVPILFPKIFINKYETCRLLSDLKYNLPFHLPCSYREKHVFDQICYHSICLLIDSLLARKFVLLARGWDSDLRDYIDKLKLHRNDLVNYLGDSYGEQLCSEIENFIKSDSSFLDDLLQDRSENKINNYVNSSFPINKASVPIIINDLRDGFKTAVLKNDGRAIGVEYAKSADYLMQIGNGTHPLIFSEVLSELCDNGVIVPITRYDSGNNCWRRLYRRGEGNSGILQWDRTKYIIPLAIRELGQDNSIHKMLLEKGLTNFIFDFPKNINQADNNFELHCLEEKASQWGPQTFAIFSPTGQGIPIDPTSLDKDSQEVWNDLASHFMFDSKDYLYRCKDDLHGQYKVFDQNCWVDFRTIRDYFKLLKILKNINGKSDVIYALAICRNESVFHRYLFESIKYWGKFYSNFLLGLKNGELDIENLNNSGKMAFSSREKIRYAATFNDFIQDFDTYIPKYPDYEDIWFNRIKPNISQNSTNLLDLPQNSILIDISNAIGMLFDLTRIKLKLISGNKLEKTQKRIITNGISSLGNVGIDLGILKWLNQENDPDFNTIYSELYNAYQIIFELIKNMKTEKDLIEIRNERAFRKNVDIQIECHPQNLDLKRVNWDKVNIIINEHAIQAGLIGFSKNSYSVFLNESGIPIYIFEIKDKFRTQMTFQFDSNFDLVHWEST
ncbi:MAG: hypothetical protein AB2L18_01580 [Anaerolineaceae bacterium]